jgi:sugar phosphate isomerase/epimerase
VRDQDGTLRWAWQACDLADGLLSTPDLLAELRRVGYDGFISVEDLRPDVGAEDKFSRAISYLRRLDA